MISIGGSIGTGGVSQTLLSLKSTPFKGYSIRNVSTGSLWVNENGTAAQTNASMEIKPGEYFETAINCPIFTNNLSIIGATTGQQFYGRYW